MNMLDTKENQLEIADTMRSSAAVRRLQTDYDASMRCQDNLAFMRPLKSEMMQLIVTSPPYNIGKSYEARTSLDAYVQSQAQVISECVRLLSPRGSLCWQVGNHVHQGQIFPLDFFGNTG